MALETVERWWFSEAPSEPTTHQELPSVGYLLRIIREGTRTCPRVIGARIELPCTTSSTAPTSAVVHSYVRSVTTRPDPNEGGRERVVVVGAADGTETEEEWRFFDDGGVPHLSIRTASMPQSDSVLAARSPPQGLVVGAVVGAAVSSVPDVPVNPVEWTCLVQSPPLDPERGGEQSHGSSVTSDDVGIVVAVGHFSSDDVPGRPVLMYRVEPVATGTHEGPSSLLLHKVYELLPHTAGVAVVYDKPKRVGGGPNVTGKWINISAAVSGWFVGTLSLSGTPTSAAIACSPSAPTSRCAACGAFATEGMLRCVDGPDGAPPVCLDCWGMACSEDPRILETLRWYIVSA